MSNQEKIEIALAGLQHRIERRIGTNPNEPKLPDFLWEVQTMRYTNAVQMTSRQESVYDKLRDRQWV